MTAIYYLYMLSFNFLFGDMEMYDNEFKTKKNNIWTNYKI